MKNYLLLLLFLVSSCGGGGGESSESMSLSQDDKLLVSGLEINGLEYSSNTYQGVTNKSYFKCKEDEIVTFSIHGKRVFDLTCPEGKLNFQYFYMSLAGTKGKNLPLFSNGTVYDRPFGNGFFGRPVDNYNGLEVLNDHVNNHLVSNFLMLLVYASHQTSSNKFVIRETPRIGVNVNLSSFSCDFIEREFRISCGARSEMVTLSRSMLIDANIDYYIENAKRRQTSNNEAEDVIIHVD